MLNPTSPLPLKDPTLFRQANCIDGKWVQADSGNTIVVKNPATGEAIGEVPALGAAETRRAIEAAHRAQAGWRAMLAKDRAAILRKLNDLMLANTDDLAVIMTAEQGKPLAESKGEIAYAASFIEWFAEEGKRVYGDTIPQNAKGRRILVLKEPIGVFAAITPWNFPAAMITRKAGPGWAAGCTGVIRPASQTPFSALALAVLAERAGMPAGVCNVITGPSGETGGGADLQSAGAQADLHRLHRGGRQAAGAVRADHQEDQHGTGRQRAVHRVRRRGPGCGGGGRDGEQVPQHRPDLRLRQPHPGAGRRLRRVRREAEGGGGGDEGRQRHGAGREPGAADQCRRGEEGGGAHRGRGEARRVRRDRRQAAQAGRQFLRADDPGQRAERRDDLPRGDVRPGGAAVPLQDRGRGDRLANDTEFGLAAYFYARDIGRIFRVAEALEYGIIGINEGIISTEVAPFGGMKSSGLGREGSKYGIEEYLEIKYLALGGIGT